MKPEIENSLRSFLVELVVYAALVAAYYLLVLHLLGHWLHGLFQDKRQAYAWIALGLIIGQGFVLELLTRLLLSLFQRRRD